MALTRPRASQIYDIDYKQATRVITVSNITLSGGAPSQVDGVNLSLDDRVLVTGQSNKAQNGIYFVNTVGSGSNGTWVRSNDTNSTGELLAGTIVMVTEGTVYHDTQWKLTTDDPIVIGTSELIFEQNSAFAFGNVYANGTAVLATSVGDVLTLAAGNNISISGNNTSKTVTIGVTGISLNSISNGTSNVNVVSSGGNVTVGVDGTGNVAVFSSDGLAITGNITGGNITTDGIVSATGNINTAGAVNITGTDGMYNVLNITGTALGPYGGSQTWQFFTQNAVPGGPGSWILFPDSSTQTTAYPGSSSALSLSGNITGGNLTANSAVVATGNITGGNIITDGLISATGNITGGNILGNGAGLTGINSFGTIAVTGGNSAVADSISDTLTITAGSGITLVMDSSTDTLTIATGASGESIFSTGGQMETVTDTVTASEDLGLVTETPPAQQYDLAGLYIDGFVGNPNFLPNSIYGNILVADAVITTTGNITGGNISGDIILSTNNGNGTNFKVGDDAWIGDINNSDTVGIKGTQSNGANAYIVFGNSDATGKLGRAGTGPLTYAGSMSVTGTITATGGENSTAFAVGNSAVSNVALGMFPTAGTAGEFAIRDYSTITSKMYFDVGMGGTATGSFDFRTSNAYTTLASINTYGITLTTNRPGFRVFGSGTTNNLTTTQNSTGALNGNNWTADFNQGSYLNSTTGVFTAPVAGLYQINVVGRNSGYSGGISQLAVIKNATGGTGSGGTVQCMIEWAASSSMNHVGSSAVARLAVNDTLALKVLAGQINFDSNDNWSVAYLG